MIKIQNLSKKYKKNTFFSLKNVNFSCDKGQIVGLVGANGAGKSTLLKCMVGYLGGFEGDIFINGFNVKTQPVQAKRQFGFISDDHAVFEALTGLEYINFMADIYGVSTQDRKTRLEKMEETFHMGERLNNLIGSYSFGMKQKICIMGVLIYEPEVWILDEPFTGLDAVTTFEVEKLMLDYKNKGKSVLFSSHDLHIVEKLCDKICIIKQGEVIENCLMSEFNKKHNGESLEDFFIKTFTTVKQTKNENFNSQKGNN